MLLLFLLSLVPNLSIASINIHPPPIQINNSTSVEYFCLYNNLTQFSTGLDSSYILNTVYNNETYCMELCANNNNCLGLFNHMVNNIQECNMLTNLGHEVYSELHNSRSYKKVVYNRINNGEHTISGYILNNRPNMNSTVYIDINHNGYLDNNEPYVNTSYTFSFDNLFNRLYLVRILNENHCLTLYPSVFGGGNYIYNDGIADIIESYNIKGFIIGGIPNNMLEENNTIEENATEILDNPNYIIENNDNYITFHNNDTIVLGFSNSTIIDTDGDDIYFNIYGNGTLNAHISVSTMFGNEHSYLGILSSDDISFDLSDINFTYPVNHIYIHFFGEGDLSIQSVIGYHHSNYFPGFSYYITASFQTNLLFIMDCSYMEHCNDYCDYTKYSWNSYISCLYGCIEMNLNTNCIYNNETDYSIYSDYSYLLTEFIEEDFMDGCEYGLQKYVWPNYILYKGLGINNNKINSINNCGDECLDNLLTSCNEDCHSFSLLDNMGYLYNSNNYTSNGDGYYMVKRDIIVPPTSIPTTLLPTTSIPTTSIPTTLLPTTYMPTVSPTIAKTINSDKTISNNEHDVKMISMIVVISLLCLIILLISISHLYKNRRRNDYDLRVRGASESFVNPIYHGTYDVNNVNNVSNDNNSINTSYVNTDTQPMYHGVERTIYYSDQATNL